MKNIKKFLFISIILSGFWVSFAQAQETNVNLIIRNGNEIIFEDSVLLQLSGTIELNGHPLNANSVLAVLNEADLASENFSITDLQYYESFGSFYLKCINDECDNWQYVVNNISPGVGMDQKILSGGEEIYIYFSQQHRIILSSSSIETNESLTVTTENYAYRNNSWEPLTGVTIGITQVNPDDPFNPTEILTSSVDENGQINFSNISAGSYNVGIKEDFYFPTENLTVTEAEHRSSGSGSRATVSTIEQTETKPVFDLNKAFNFLISQQKENGSFGEDIYTEWTALAFSSSLLYKEETIKLIGYFLENKSPGTLLTDFERHAMALMSLGLNPYNTNGENYIKKITDSFDGQQFGDIEKDNDDIFALLVLQNTGFTKNEKMITDDISFILNRQKENGSWDESVDMTSAGIQALIAFNQDEQARPNDLQVGQVKNALEKAKEFLKQNQKDDGSWGNVSSTAWAIGGIWALSEKPENWIKNNNTPLDYLAANQNTDGGIKNLPGLGEADEYLQSKIWETAYTITALSGKTWNQIMQKFEKPKEIKEESLENSPRTVLENLKVPKSKIAKRTTHIAKNPENLASQNTATVINSLEKQNPEPKKENWFINFLNKIFSIF